MSKYPQAQITTPTTPFERELLPGASQKEDPLTRYRQWDCESKNARTSPHCVDTGASDLMDYEVIGYEGLQRILSLVPPIRDTAPMTKALLKRFRTLDRVLNASAAELMAVDGLSKCDLEALSSVSYVLSHMSRKAITSSPVLYDSDDLKYYLAAKLRHERVEVLFILYMNIANYLIKDEELCRGTIDFVPLYPREVIRRCLELDAKSIIVAHNHPSGHPNPSREDVMLTNDLIRAAGLFDIVVKDHVVVGANEILSFRSHGLI